MCDPMNKWSTCLDALKVLLFFTQNCYFYFRFGRLNSILLSKNYPPQRPSTSKACALLCFLSSLWETIKRFSARKQTSLCTRIYLSTHRRDRLNRLSHTLRLCFPSGCLSRIARTSVSKCASVFFVGSVCEIISFSVQKIKHSVREIICILCPK